MKPDAVPSNFEGCTGWEKLLDGTYKFTRKPPKDRSVVHIEKQIILDVSVDEDTNVGNMPQESQPSLQQQVIELQQALAAKDQEIAKKESTIQNLQVALQMEKWGIHRFTTDNEKIKYYTGFVSYDLFLRFYEAVKPSADHMNSAYYYRAGEKRSLAGRPRTMLLIDELFMFLMRIRINCAETDLAVRFGVSDSTVSRKLLTWTTLLYQILGSLPLWLSRDDVKQSMPPCFRSEFPSTRVIIDCTEIPTQYASSLVLNSQLYSTYKSRPTLKCLVGVSPSGAFTFISHLFCGSMSDIAITKLSGLLDLLEPGDMVMADKGFNIGKLLEGKGVDLNLPPFLSSMKQFTPDEIEQTEQIASARIHVERAIGRVKEYSIFEKVPLSMIGSVNQLWVVACILCNFQPPLISTR